MTSHTNNQSTTPSSSLLKWAVALSLVSLFLYGIGIALWQYFTPPIHDDITYQFVCTGTSESDFWKLDGPLIQSFSDACFSAWNHWVLVNGRLANILMILFVPLPAWVLSVCQGLMSMVVAYLMFYFGLGRRCLRYSWLWAAVLLGIWKFFPWYENFGSDDFMINYMWSCAFSLGLLYFIYNLKKVNTPAKIFGISVLAFCTGMMHEGFSLPVLFAVALLFFFPGIAPGWRKNLPKGWRKRLAWPLAFLAVGCFVCVFAPSTIDRLMRKDHDLPPASAATLVRFFFRFMLPMYLYVAMCALVWMRCGVRVLLARLREQVIWLVLVVAVCAMLVVLSMAASRMLLLPNAIFLILSMQMLREAFGQKLRPLKALAVVLIAVQVLFFEQLLSLQYQVGKQVEDCIAEYQRRNDGKVFVDNAVSWQDLPWWTFAMIQDPMNNNKQIYLQLCNYTPRFQQCNRSVALVLPKELEGFSSFNDLPALPGDNPFRGTFSTILSPVPLAIGEKVGCKYGEAFPIVVPFNRKNFPVGAEGVLEVLSCNPVPALEPETVYAIFLTDPSDRFNRQAVTELTYPLP